MANKIQIKRSTTAATTPTLDVGELGVNLTDRKLWVGGNGAGNIALGGDGLYLNRLDGRVRLGSKWGHFPETTGTVHYVDAANGSDSNSGTVGSPKATVISAMGNVTAGDTVVMYAGTYDMANYFLGSSNNITAAYSINTTFIAAEPGKVKWTNIEEFTTTTACTIKYYGIWFASSTGGWTHLTGNAGVTNSIRYFYNCFFKGLSNNLTWGYLGTIHMFNCTVDDSFYAGYDYGDGTLQNTACTSTFANAPGSGGTVTSNTNLPSISLGVDANISSSGWENTGTGRNPDGTRANIGVYGGPYAWTKDYKETFGNAPDAAFTNLVATGDLSAPNIIGKPDAYTKLLIHSDTTDGRGTFTDSSPGNIPITTGGGDPTHETEQSKFGASSLYVDGDDYLDVGGAVAAHTDVFYDVDGLDFTYDFWVNRTGSGRRGLISSHDGTADDIEIEFTSANKIMGGFRKDASNFHGITTTTALSANTWYHIALIRHNGLLKIYVNGTLEATHNTVWTGDIYNRTGKLFIGRYGTMYHQGYLDEIRISVGIARWQSNFTPPTRPYATFSAGDGVFTGELVAPRIAGDTTLLGSLTVGTINATGDLTLDSADGIILDADGGSISLKDGGTRFGILSNSSSNFVIENAISDKDILFKVKDDDTTITALTLDGSNNGTAIFSGGVNLTTNQNIHWGNTYSFISGDGTNTTGNLKFYTSDTLRLTIDGAGAATFSGTVGWSGGGSANANTAYTYSQVGHLPLTAKAADSNLLDGVDSTSFLRSDAADTASGAMSFTGLCTFAKDVHIYEVGADRNLWISEGTSGSGLTNVQLSPNGISYLKGGNVGIGTASPGTYKLYVAGTTYLGGALTANSTLHTGGGAGINGSIVCTSTENNQGLKRDTPANAFSWPMNISSIGTAPVGTFTIDGKFELNDNHQGWNAGFKGDVTYPRVANRCLEFTVDTADSGSSTAQADHVMVGWYGSGTTGTHSELVHAWYLDKGTSGTYRLEARENGSGVSSVATVTWGDVIVFRIILKATGADYYYKRNDGPWTLGYVGGTVTTSNLTPGMSVYTGRYHIHSMHVYDWADTVTYGTHNIYGPADGTGYLHINDSVTTAVAGNGMRLGYNSGELRLQNFESTDIAFFLGTTERVTFTSTGNVLIGTGSTLYASGAATFSGHVGVGGAADTSNNSLHLYSLTSGHDAGITLERSSEKATIRYSGYTTEGLTIEDTQSDSLIRLIADDVTVSGALTVSGAASFNTITSNLVGTISGLFNLGTSALKWGHLNMSGTATIGGGVSVTGSSSFEGASFSSGITGTTATFSGALTRTTAGTAAATAGHNWYSLVDAENIVKVKDGNELYFEKEGAANYEKWVYWGEEVGRNFDLAFRLKMAGPSSGYRHFGIAIASDGSSTNANFDFIVFRHYVGSSSNNQIRIDVATATQQSLVGTSVPNFADGTERSVLIQVRNQEYTIEVDGVLVHSFRATVRTRQRGIVGFCIYEGADANTWATIRNFKIKHYSTHKTMLPPTQVGETREGNDGLVIAGLYSTTDPALTFTTGHGSAGNTNTWDLGAITCDDDGSYNGKMAFRVSSGSGLNAGRHGGFATAMTIKQTTHIGIGTVAPSTSYKLDVVGSIRTSATLSADSIASATGNFSGAVGMGALTGTSATFSGAVDITGGLIVAGASTLGDGNDTTHVKGSLVVDTNIYGPSLGAVAIAAGLKVNDTSLSVIAGTVTVDRAATNKFANGDFANDGTGWTFGSWTAASYSYTFPAFSGSGVSGFSKVCRIERDASGGVAHFHQSSIFANSTVFSVGLWVRGDGTFRINSHWGILKTLALTSTWQYMTVTTTSNATTGHFIYLAADLITTYCEVTGVMIEQAATASTFTDVTRSSGDIVLHGQVKSLGTGSSYFKGDVSITGDLAVSGTINQTGQTSRLFNHPVPGLQTMSATLNASTVSYIDSGYNLVAGYGFRGVVWTGQHYIFTEHGSDTIHFYDSFFQQVKNEDGVLFETLPNSPASPHGAAWDGRYLWMTEYTGATNGVWLNAYDIYHGDITRVAHCQIDTDGSGAGICYAVGYAEGLLYTFVYGRVRGWRWDGGDTLTMVVDKSVSTSPTTWAAQGITYDGSYIWATQQNSNTYKLNLDGSIHSTIGYTAGQMPPNITGWTWNGENIVCFDYINRDIYIINTAQRVFLTEKVGIGTTVPSTVLHIKGATADSGKLLIQSGTLANNNRASLFMTATNVNGNTGNVSIECIHPNNQQSELVMRTGATDATTFGTERMRITTDGNVGIGTDNPDALLTVGGVDDGLIHIKDDAGNNTIQIRATEATYNEIDSQREFNLRTEAGALRFTTANVERMRIDSNGNVGIGIAAVAAMGGKLNVGERGSGTADINIGIDNNNRTILYYNGGKFTIGTRYNSTNYFDTLRVQSGLVGIGADAGIWKLYVNGITKINGALECDALSPAADNTHALGNTSRRWSSVTAVAVTGVTGNFTGALTGTSATFSGQLTSTLANGTPPLVVTSATKVTNLNADLLDGLTSSSFTPFHVHPVMFGGIWPAV